MQHRINCEGCAGDLPQNSHLGTRQTCLQTCVVNVKPIDEDAPSLVLLIPRKMILLIAHHMLDDVRNMRLELVYLVWL